MPIPGSGLAKGLAVTLRTMTKRSVTAQYPDAQPELPPRSRGVIALFEENCTVCMLCARECPDWCVYIDSHKETVPAAAPGGRERSRNVLDRFAIDFSLCMYCGICIEVCPFDALFWSPEFEYAETDILELTHERDKLRDWMWTVPAPPALDPAAEEPKEARASGGSGSPGGSRGSGASLGRRASGGPVRRGGRGVIHSSAHPGFMSPTGAEITFVLVGLATLGAALVTVTTRQLVHAALWLVVALGGIAVEYLLLTAEFIAWVQVLIYVGSVVVLLLFGLMLTRAPIGHSPDADSENRWVALAVAVAAAGTLVWVVVDAFRSTWITVRQPGQSPTKVTGSSLFRFWVLPFEALSVLLLAALVGAIVLSRRRSDPDAGAPPPAGPSPAARVRPAPAGPASDAKDA
jgi:NADH-quinone oxidoreductase subunit I